MLLTDNVSSLRYGGDGNSCQSFQAGTSTKASHFATIGIVSPDFREENPPPACPGRAKAGCPSASEATDTSLNLRPVHI